jgi:hypothetical protein
MLETEQQVIKALETWISRNAAERILGRVLQGQKRSSQSLAAGDWADLIEGPLLKELIQVFPIHGLVGPLGGLVKDLRAQAKKGPAVAIAEPPLKPGQAQPIQPGQAQTSQPGRGQPSQPGQAQPIQPGRGQPVQPGRAQTSQPSQGAVAVLPAPATVRAAPGSSATIPPTEWVMLGDEGSRRNLVQEIARMDGVVAAVLETPKGSEIRAPNFGKGLPRLISMSHRLLALRGNYRVLYATFERGQLLIRPLGQGWLAVLARPEANLGQLLYRLRYMEPKED